MVLKYAKDAATYNEMFFEYKEQLIVVLSWLLQQFAFEFFLEFFLLGLKIGSMIN